MLPSTRLTRLALPLFLMAFPLGCYDEPEPTEAVQLGTAASNVVAAMGELHDVPAVMMDLPPQPRPWDTSAVALEDALAEADGHATVTFKARAASRDQRR